MSRPVPAGVLDEQVRAWLELRASRPDAAAPQFHGTVGAQAERASGR